MAGDEKTGVRQIINVQELRYLNPRDATTRYGTGFMGGAIVITTR